MPPILTYKNPTSNPTTKSTTKPSNFPTKYPTTRPTKRPSKPPTQAPTKKQTDEPTVVQDPQTDETMQPTNLGKSVISFHESFFKIFKMLEFLKKSPFYEKEEPEEEKVSFSNTLPTLPPASEDKASESIQSPTTGSPTNHVTSKEKAKYSQEKSNASPTKIPTYEIAQRYKYPTTNSPTETKASTTKEKYNNEAPIAEVESKTSPTQAPTYKIEQRYKYPTTSSPKKTTTNNMKEKYKNEIPKEANKSPTQAPTYKIEQRYKYPTTNAQTKKTTNNMKEKYKNEEPKNEKPSTQMPTYKIEQRYKYPTTNSPTKKPTNKMKEQYKNEEPTGEEKSPTQAPTYKIEQRYKYPTTSSPTKKPTKLPTQNPTIASNQDDITKVITSYEKVPGEETTGISTNSPTKKPTKIKATNNPTKSPTNKPKSTATKMPTPKIAIPKLQYANTEISCDVMTTFLKKRVIEKKVTESSLTPQVFQNKNTPQYKALNWMLNDDNLNTICVNNDDKVLQRYMAALFYFSTGGEYWLNQYDFLNGNTHECTWSNRMVCNDENYIMDIIFSEYSVNLC